MADPNAQALRDLAEAHLAAVRKRLASECMGRFVMFIEVVRALDYWGISAYGIKTVAPDLARPLGRSLCALA